MKESEIDVVEEKKKNPIVRRCALRASVELVISRQSGKDVKINGSWYRLDRPLSYCLNDLAGLAIPLSHYLLQSDIIVREMKF